MAFSTSKAMIYHRNMYGPILRLWKLYVTQVVTNFKKGKNYRVKFWNVQVAHV